MLYSFQNKARAKQGPACRLTLYWGKTHKELDAAAHKKGNDMKTPIETTAGTNIETKRLWIRRFHPADWRDLYEYLSQEAVVKFEPYEVFTETAGRQEAERRSKDNSYWAVCLKDGGKLIGNLYLAKQDFGTWELGYVFNEKYQGKGYATEAGLALLDDVFRNQHARRVIALCNPLNEPSWKLLERLGFRREGHLLKNIYFKKDKDGEPIWADTFEYAILGEEWAAQQPYRAPQS